MDIVMDFYGVLLFQYPTWGLISGVLFVTLFLAYLGLPFVVWAIVILAALWGVGLSLPIYYGVLSFCVICMVKPLRAQLITRWLFLIIKVANIFPTVSETERIALEAGNTWLDKDLFSGKPNISKMMKEAYPSLAEDEKAFIDGPVEELCKMVNDWDLHCTRELPEKAWRFIKKQRLFGMIIPKKYGGLELSPLAHSAIISKLSSRSSALGITVMVPNSLGPAELLIHYGTDKQKDYYLPRLAKGEEIPCFALTEPTAGSDAGAMRATGEVFRKRNGELYMRLNFEKRWITLSGISTIIGLAFQLYDPKNLLGQGENLGITCALIPRDTKGVVVDTRHDPMGVPFYNCPLKGKNVEVPVSCIIGGAERAGQGWRMLMECLSAGRGISLPANATGGAKLVTRAASSFAKVRKQFGLSIGAFEGVEEPLARMGGYTYMMDAARKLTCGVLEKGVKPSVISAIMKYHCTEKFRSIINDGLDVMGGAGISCGPRNVLASPYFATPIGITVEGANILTRTMIIFGQGALRCHPYAYDEVNAVNNNNLLAFDKAIWGHILHVLSNVVRSIVLSWTRGLSSCVSFFSPLSRYKRRLMWASASYAALADICMGSYGGRLKFKEKITGRLADILSFMYFATAIMRRYEAEGKKKEDLVYVKWGLDYCFHQVQEGFDGIFSNMDGILKYILGAWSHINRIGTLPSDYLGHKIAVSLQTPTVQRDRLTAGIYYPDNPEDALGRWEHVFEKVWAADAVIRKMKNAIRTKKLSKKPVDMLIEDALKAKIITKKDALLLEEAESLRMDAIQVDSFTQKQYLGMS